MLPDPEKLKEAHKVYWDLLPSQMRENGKWIVASVKGAIAWPTKVESVAFRGHKIFLVPGTDFFYPSVCVNYPVDAFEIGQKYLMHFLSSLTWVQQQNIRVMHWTGGNLPRPMGKDLQLQIVTDNFSLDYFPDPQEPKIRRAMALYREGLSLQHNGYAYLSFFKIINMLKSRGAEQEEWVNNNIAHVKEHLAKQRLSVLSTQSMNIGKYLTYTNRCAIAHAYADTDADPENIEDDKRFRDDLPLIREFAKIVIEREYGIKTSSTVWLEHLYELEGFRALFGPELTAKLKAGEAIALKNIPPVPALSIGLKSHPTYPCLAKVTVDIIEIDSGKITLRCYSPHKTTQMILTLDFVSERLVFDPYAGLASFDDNSADAAQEAAHAAEFIGDFIANGALEVSHAGTGELLGRCDAFLPCNIDPGRTRKHLRLRRDQFLALTKQRSFEDGAKA